MQHYHKSATSNQLADDKLKVVLVGNPNCGKSVVFNALTGRYADVSNYPGTTVDITSAELDERHIVIDTPGVYGISAFNEEERVTRDVVLQADVLINVLNAEFLERELFLTLQLLDMGKPLIVAVNMLDEAERSGIVLDMQALEDALGVPVVPLIAIQGFGIKKLKKSIASARKGNADPAILEQLAHLLSKGVSQAEALLILEDNHDIAAQFGFNSTGAREGVYLQRRKRVDELVRVLLQHTGNRTRWMDKLGQMLMQPLTGIPALGLILYCLYQVIGVLVAQNIVGITETVVMEQIWQPFIIGLVSRYVSPYSVLGQILIGEFGLLTMTVTYILGLLLPLVVAFYLMLSLLEDSGYLPRLAALLDGALTKLGLNGRAVIPLILGFGCVTMAALTTRLLGSRRERTIALVLLGVTIPCSAQLGVIAAMVAPLGWQLTGVYLLTIFAVFVLIGTLLNRLLPGASTDLLIDIPPLRLPRLSNVFKKSAVKSFYFLREASLLFVLGALLLSVMQMTGMLTALQELAAPLTVGWLKLPKEAANAFVMGVVRRDFGAAGLYDLALTPKQTVVALITVTLFVPCIASGLVFVKERGLREAAVIWVGSLVIAFVVGGSVAQLLI